MKRGGGGTKRKEREEVLGLVRLKEKKLLFVDGMMVYRYCKIIYRGTFQLNE